MIRKTLIFSAFLVAIGAWEWVGLVWSFATFHPGGDVEISREVRHQAFIGDMMSLPFFWHQTWYFGRVALFVPIILPFIYAAFCTWVTLFALRRRDLRSQRRDAGNDIEKPR